MNCGVEVVFVGNNNTEIYSETMSREKIEIVLMCVLGGNIPKKDLPIFKQGYCYNFDYVKKFWEYFNVARTYETTCYVGLFITGLRVRGYDVDMFCEQMVLESKNGCKRKREYKYSIESSDSDCS